jgi:endoglucanase
LPLQALRRLAAVAPAQTAAQWQSLLHSSQRVLIESAPRGFAPDWVLYAADQGFVPDHQGEQQALGAYNAIRKL